MYTNRLLHLSIHLCPDLSTFSFIYLAISLSICFFSFIYSFMFIDLLIYIFLWLYVPLIYLFMYPWFFSIYLYVSSCLNLYLYCFTFTFVYHKILYNSQYESRISNSISARDWLVAVLLWDFAAAFNGWLALAFQQGTIIVKWALFHNHIVTYERIHTWAMRSCLCRWCLYQSLGKIWGKKRKKHHRLISHHQIVDICCLPMVQKDNQGHRIWLTHRALVQNKYRYNGLQKDSNNKSYTVLYNITL